MGPRVICINNSYNNINNVNDYMILFLIILVRVTVQDKKLGYTLGRIESHHRDTQSYTIGKWQTPAGQTAFVLWEETCTYTEWKQDSNLKHVKWLYYRCICPSFLWSNHLPWSPFWGWSLFQKIYCPELGDTLDVKPVRVGAYRRIHSILRGLLF